MKIRDLMHRGIEVMSPETPVAKLAQRMRELDIGAIPVGTKEALQGMVTDRDIALRAVANGKDVSKLTAADVMTKGAICCSEDEKVKDVLRMMEEKQVRRIPVCNEKKHFIGMISIGDISQAMPDRLTAEVMKAVSAHHA